jgi:hypothetical protein
MHFSAKELHEALLNFYKDNSRLKIINKNIANPEEVDSDFVFVCSGAPKELNEKDYENLEEVPVNAVYVVQCDWDSPRFNYSLTNAMKYG